MPNVADSKAVTISNTEMFHREWKLDTKNQSTIHRYIPNNLFLPDGRLVSTYGCKIKIWSLGKEGEEAVEHSIHRFHNIFSVVLLSYPQLILLDEESRLWHLNLLTQEMFSVSLKEQAYMRGYNLDSVFRLFPNRIAVKWQGSYNILDSDICVPALQDLFLLPSNTQSPFVCRTSSYFVEGLFNKSLCPGLITSFTANHAVPINDRYLAVARMYRGNGVGIYDLHYNFFLSVLEGEECGPSKYVGLVENGRSFLSIHIKGWQIWDIEQRVCNRSFITNNFIKLFEMLKDGRHFIIVWENAPNIMELWDIDSCEPLDQFNVNSEVLTLASHTNGLIAYGTSTHNAIFNFPYLRTYLTNISLPFVTHYVDLNLAELILNYLNVDLQFPACQIATLTELNAITVPHKILFLERNSDLQCVGHIRNEIIIYGQKDGTLRIMDAQSLLEIHRFQFYLGDPKFIIHLSSYLVACYYVDSTVCIYDFTKPTEPTIVKQFEIGTNVEFIARYSETQLLFVSINHANSYGHFTTCITIWDYNQEKRVSFLNMTGNVEISCLMVSHQEKLFYCESKQPYNQNFSLALATIGTLLPIRQEIASSNKLSHLIELSDNIIVGVNGNKIHVWTIRPLIQLRTFVLKPQIYVNYIKAMPDGEHFCGVTHLDEIQLWHVQMGLVDSVSVEANIKELTVLFDGRVIYLTDHVAGVIDFPYLQKNRRKWDPLLINLPEIIATEMGAPKVIGNLTKEYIGKDFCFWQSPFKKQSKSKTDCVIVIEPDEIPTSNNTTAVTVTAPLPTLQS